MLKNVQIISGGQTGSDRAALDFALANRIACGGFCPKGRIAEDGIIPEKYPLTEIDSERYEERTKKNVKESDGTLIFVWQRTPAEGTRKTIHYCQEYHKPYYICQVEDLKKMDEYCSIPQWLIRHQINILNIAGNRESEDPGIYQKTLEALHLLSNL